MRKEPLKPELVKKIIKEVGKHQDGIWIRKLARILKEPVMSVHKYVNREDYCGKYLILEKRKQELGGHLIIKLKKGDDNEKQ